MNVVLMDNKKEINPMRDIFIEKVVVNIGTGNDAQKQKSAKKLLELITGKKPIDEISKKRIPSFKISKGAEIGAYVTVRGNSEKLIKMLFDAVDNKLKESSVINNSVNFGIREYIDLGGIKYDPKIGMLGMNVNIAFKRKGMHVERRKRKAGIVHKRHKIIEASEIKEYLKNNFDVNVV
jgi:large subunit ribosomal protein L5